jgi:hypothetical protein
MEEAQEILLESRGSACSTHVGRAPDFNVYEPKLFEFTTKLQSADKPVSTGKIITHLKSLSKDFRLKSNRAQVNYIHRFL